jgi:hypothetical protein
MPAAAADVVAAAAARAPPAAPIDTDSAMSALTSTDAAAIALRRKFEQIKAKRAAQKSQQHAQSSTGH